MQQRSLYRLVCDGWSLTLLSHTCTHSRAQTALGVLLSPQLLATTIKDQHHHCCRHGVIKQTWGNCFRSPSLTTNKPTQTHKTNHQPAPTTRSHPMTKTQLKIALQPATHDFHVVKPGGHHTHTQRETQQPLRRVSNELQRVAQEQQQQTTKRYGVLI